MEDDLKREEEEEEEEEEEGNFLRGHNDKTLNKFNL